MRRVIWSETARTDYFAILQHIAEDDPEAAQHVLARIWQTGQDLSDFATGHPGRFAGTYEKSVRGLPYILAYALAPDDQVLVILRVIHTARDWPDDAWPQ